MKPPDQEKKIFHDRVALVVVSIMGIAVIIFAAVAIWVIDTPPRPLPPPPEKVVGTIQSMELFRNGDPTVCGFTQIDLGEDGIWFFRGRFSGLTIGKMYEFSYKDSRCGNSILKMVEILEVET